MFFIDLSALKQALAFINRFLLRWFYEKSSLTPLQDGETERILQNAIRTK